MLMKLSVPHVALVALLLWISCPAPSAGSLQCYSCDTGTFQCFPNVTCAANDVCGQSEYTDDSGVIRPYHRCVHRSQCDSLSAAQFLGLDAPVSCCNTTNCNVQDLGLQCQTCTDSSCSSQRSVSCSKLAPYCFSGATAVTFAFRNFTFASNGTGKGCATALDCVDPEPEFISSYNGFRSFVYNLTCCQSDECNAPQFSVQTPPAGSLECYGCDANSVNCTTRVTCRVQESCTIVRNPDESVFYGCLSENLCHGGPLAQRHLPNRNVSCCNMNLCNRAAPPLSTQAPPRGPPPTTDGSVFSGAEQVLAPALLLSLLLLCVLTCHSELTH